MGSSSKVILVGATTLIVSTYAVSLKQVQTKQVAIASAEVGRIQDEQTLDAAMRAALDDYVLANGASNQSDTLVALGGGTFVYEVKNNAGSTTLMVKLTRDGGTKVATTRITKTATNVKLGSRKIHRGKWEAGSTFVSK